MRWVRSTACVLGGGVPPRVEHEAVVGLGEVEAEPAGLQADDEHRGVAVLEPGDGLVALRGCGRRGSCRRCRRRRAGCGPGPGSRVNWLKTRARWPSATTWVRSSTSRSSLAEPTVSCSSSTSAGSRASWRRMVSDLRISKRCFCDVADEAEDLLALPLELGLVDPGVAGAELDLDGLLGLGRQLGEHRVLGAAAHERGDASPEGGEQLGGLAALDRLAVGLAEPLRVGVEAGSGDRQQRPQVHERVLERGAGDGDLGGGVEAADALVGLALVVLDELGLVEQQELPVVAGVGVELDAEQRVGGDDERGAVDLLGQRGAPAGGGLADGPHVDGRERSGRPPGPSSPPRWWGRRRGTGRRGRRSRTWRQRARVWTVLPRPMSSARMPPRPVAVQERQPVEAVLLVVAQRGVEAGGRGHRCSGAARARHAADAVGPALRLLGDHAEAGELVPPAGLEPVEAGDAVAGGLGQAPGLVDELPQPGELGPVEAQPGARRQDEGLVAAVEGGEEARRSRWSGRRRSPRRRGRTSRCRPRRVVVASPSVTTSEMSGSSSASRSAGWSPVTLDVDAAAPPATGRTSVSRVTIAGPETVRSQGDRRRRRGRGAGGWAAPGRSTAAVSAARSRLRPRVPCKAWWTVRSPAGSGPTTAAWRRRGRCDRPTRRCRRTGWW